MNTIGVRIKLYEGATIPHYATEGSAGFDLIAHSFIESYSATIEKPQIPDSRLTRIMLLPHSRLLIGCGFSLEIPIGKLLDIRSRSGKSFKEGLVVANSPGTIDSDYRGEIKVILLNTSEFPLVVNIRDKIAQAVLIDYYTIYFDKTNELSDTKRSSQGFGSTG